MASKVGSYAVTTIQSRPWMTASATPCTSNSTATKPRKSKAQPVIVHNIFSECAQLTDDSLWKDLFENASYGKFPRGFTYRDGVLTYKIRSKVFTLEMPSVPYEALPQCVDFMKRTARITSEADKERDRFEIEERLKEQVALDQCSWNDIKKKKVKALLLSSYIENVARQRNYNTRQKDYFKMILNIGFALGYLNKDDIVFEKGHITRIEGLILEPKVHLDPNRAPKLKKSSKHQSETTTATKSKFSFLDLWYDLVNYYVSLVERRRVITSNKLQLGEISPETSQSRTTLPTTASSSHIVFVPTTD